MTEPQNEYNEYMDTGALTEDAVPDQFDASEESYEEPAPVDAGPMEAPGSPSSESVTNPAAPSPDGSGPSASSLPLGAEIFEDPKDAEQVTIADNGTGGASALPNGAQIS